MASFTIDALRALPDYAQVTKWDVRFLTLPVIGPFAFPVTQEMNLRCETAEIPKTTNQKIEVDVRGHKVIQPGINNYTNTITLTFTETVDNAIHLFIKAWRELVWGTRSGTQFPKNQLEAIIQLQRLNNQDEPVWDYVLYGCFIEDYDLGTLDGGTSDIMRPSVTLSYDFFTDRPL